MAVAVAASTAGADDTRCPTVGVNIADVEVLIQQLDRLIEAQDLRLSELAERIDFETDPLRRQQLRSTSVQWTQVLDQMEAQRDVVTRLVSELRCQANDTMEQTE